MSCPVRPVFCMRSPDVFGFRVRKTGRKRTLSVALPASIVENAQGGELKALLVGQIARALTIYGVDEAGHP